jgi:hypothetical protein
MALLNLSTYLDARHEKLAALVVDGLLGHDAQPDMILKQNTELNL